MGTIKDYRKMVEQPWGKMFYEMIFKQLNIQNDKRIRILDFGAGPAEQRSRGQHVRKQECL